MAAVPQTVSGVPVAHVASSPIDGHQHCRLCGATLIDASARPDLTVCHFEAGAGVLEFDGRLWLVDGAVPPHARPCVAMKGANPCL